LVLQPFNSYHSLIKLTYISSLPLYVTLRCLVCIVLARLLFNSLFSKLADKLANRHGQTDAHKDGRKLLEEAWVLLGNIFMLSIAGFIMAKRNEGCWFGNVKPCLVGWPNHSVNSAVTIYYSLELAWYAHLLLKPVFKYGLPDGRDMMIHHCASIALLIASCGLNLTRMGVVVLTLFGISNPALHAAKITNQLHLGKIRAPAFSFFALTFFVTRVLLVPPVVLVPALVHSRHWIQYAVEDFHTAYSILNLLLWALYAMQLVWMWAILRVLRQAAENGMDAASKLSIKVDPAKRYAAGAAGTTAAVVGDGTYNGATIHGRPRRVKAAAVKYK
jgi:hypothetical protein